MLWRLFVTRPLLSLHLQKLYFQNLSRKMCCEAYFRWTNEMPSFHFSFYLEKSDLGISRNFNFSRQITETVGEFQNRVRTNLDKTLSKKKKKRKNDETDETIEIDFTLNGSAIAAEMNCKDAMLQGGVVMKLLKEEFLIQVNAPWINLLTISDSMLAGFPTYPYKVELEFADKKDCEYIWLKSQPVPDDQDKKKNVNHLEWTPVGNEYCYTPNSEDIGCHLKLKCTPIADSRKGPSVEVVSKCKVQAGPGESPFELRHAFTQQHLEGKSFRVVSYNLLADLYADSDYSRTVLFPYCPPYAIAMDYRKQLILKELIGYHGDIMCLQEVDNKVFDLDLTPVLGSLGYSGVFSKKGGQVTEGLACFYKDSRFQLLSTQSITLGEEIPTNPLFAHLNQAIQSNVALKTRILDRGTILQVVVLKHRETDEVLVIGVTHLYFHPDADHVRLLQSAACLCFLQHALQECQQKVTSRVSLLFCGDFNSTPEYGVYHLMTRKHIPTDYRDWSSNEEEAVKVLSLCHDLHMDSACGTPKYTNFTVGFADCLDYIFYQKDNLRVEQVIPLPSEEELRQHTAIPSVVLPSDHVALVADLAWT